MHSSWPQCCQGDRGRVVTMADCWFWPAPRDGEIFPDYPPVDLSGYIVEGSLRLSATGTEPGAVRDQDAIDPDA